LEAELADKAYDTQDAPSNELEKQLHHIWKDILGTGQMGIHDTFFEWGGDSLSVTLLVNRIRKSVQVEVTLQEVFREPTIRGLAELIQSKKQSHLRLEPLTAAGIEDISIEPAPKMEVYPVTSAQKRLYFIDFLNGAGTSYNVPVVHLLTGNLQRARVEHALHQLLLRHEALRTGFTVVDGEVMQFIEDSSSFELELVELKEDDVEPYLHSFIRPFDLKHPPLIRAALASIGQDRHLLILDMHHIVTDGLSMTILTKEFAELYEGKELPPLKIQYKDFAAWQHKRQLSDSYLRQEQFWLETLAGELKPLELAIAYPRPSTRSFEGAIIESALEPAVSLQLRELAAQSGTTLFMLLMAAYSILLSKHSGREDIIIGTPISGRVSQDVEGLIGMFVGTLPMRYFPSKRTDIVTYLSEVKERTLKAFENQEYPLEKMVEKLGIQWETNRNPLFDTMFQYDHYGMHEIVPLTELSVTPYSVEQRTAKFDLTMSTSMEADVLKIKLEYATALFSRPAAQALLSDYIKIVTAIVSNPKLLIGEIELEAPSLGDGEEVTAIEFQF
ncbi:condensation domain-containing protein, partial [Paenibacillus xylaniclasticus]|uniref:condensation domain-containing protein n=1 Tax=Paenibacillus xylaniclasticus TaxID=588083 RepID=UPI001FE856A9